MEDRDGDDGHKAKGLDARVAGLFDGLLHGCSPWPFLPNKHKEGHERPLARHNLQKLTDGLQTPRITLIIAGRNYGILIELL